MPGQRLKGEGLRHDEPAASRGGPAAAPSVAAVLDLQRGAGNAAVARLAAAGRLGGSGRTLARGWSDARSGGWNKQDTEVAGTLRIPLDGLPNGAGRDPQPATAEAATHRAIVVIPDTVDLSQNVEVLLHFHGQNVGQRETGGTVRDLNADMIEQQLSASRRNIVAVLPQGGKMYSHGRFAIGDPTTYVNDVLGRAVSHVPAARRPPSAPTASRVIFSGHSAGGSNAIIYANRAQAAGSDPDAWAASPPLLVFDGLANDWDRNELWRVVQLWLDADKAVLTAPGAVPADLLQRRGMKLRSIASSGSHVSYRTRNDWVKRQIRGWFSRNVPAALSSVASTWEGQYQVDSTIRGTHEHSVGTGRQEPGSDPVPSGVTGRGSTRAGVPHYSGSGGHLHDALNNLPPNPAPAAPQQPAQAQPAATPTAPVLTPKRRLDRQADPALPPPTEEQRARAATELINACDIKAQEHRINTAQVCLVETPDGTPGTAEITHLPASYVRRTLENRATGNAELRTAFDAAVGRILQSRSDMMIRNRAYQEVPGILRLLETQFINDPNASTLDLLGPDRSRHYRQGVRWGEQDYPGGQAGANEGQANRMAAELSRIRPERRSNAAGNERALGPADMRVPRMAQFVRDSLVPVPDLQGNFRLNRHAEAQFTAMRQAAAAEGIQIEPAGGPGSFYRTPAATAAAAARHGPNAGAAVAQGLSSHNLGLAVDLRMSHGRQNFAETDTTPMRNVVDMRQSPVHKWLFVRGARWGFYPYQNEPWHWEYNPPGFRDLLMREYREWIAANPAPARR